MNKNRLQGYRRDRAILAEIEKRKVLTTDQIYQLFFSHLKQGERICRRRLKALVDAGKLKRNRLSLEQPFYYFLNPIKQVEHIIETNWVYVKLFKNLPSWETLFHFSYENDYGLLRCDAFAGVKNTITEKHRFYFIETDLSENRFDKVEKYNQLYEQNHNWWWVQYAEKFPTIIIATYREKYVKKKVEIENRNNLNFEIWPLSYTVISTMICTETIP